MRRELQADFSYGPLHGRLTFSAGRYDDHLELLFTSAGAPADDLADRLMGLATGHEALSVRSAEQGQVLSILALHGGGAPASPEERLDALLATLIAAAPGLQVGPREPLTQRPPAVDPALPPHRPLGEAIPPRPRVTPARRRDRAPVSPPDRVSSTPPVRRVAGRGRKLAVPLDLRASLRRMSRGLRHAITSLLLGAHWRRWLARRATRPAPTPIESARRPASPPALRPTFDSPPLRLPCRPERTVPDPLADGIAAFEQGRLEEAVACLRRACDAEPERPEPHYQLGLVYAAQQKLTKAVSQLEQAVKLGGGPQVQADLEELRAMRKYLKSIKKDPRDAQAHLRLGVLYFMREMGDAALAEYDLAARLQPHLVEPHLYRGLEYHYRGERELAEREYREAIRLRPNDPMAHRCLELLERGDLDLATMAPDQRDRRQLRH